MCSSRGFDPCVVKVHLILYTPPYSAIGIPDVNTFLDITDTASTCRPNMAHRGIDGSTNNLKFGDKQPDRSLQG